MCFADLPMSVRRDLLHSFSCARNGLTASLLFLIFPITNNAELKQAFGHLCVHTQVSSAGQIPQRELKGQRLCPLTMLIDAGCHIAFLKGLLVYTPTSSCVTTLAALHPH